MSISHKKFKVPLTQVFPSKEFPVLSISTKFEWKNKEKTDNIIGYAVEVACPDSFEKFVVVVQEKPDITQDDIDNSEDRIWISFEDAFATPYEVQYGRAKLSVKAKALTVVSK